MASVETKKQSAPAGKVANPKGPAATGTSANVQAPADLDEALVKAVGARVRVTTVGPQSQTFEGTLFTTDRLTNIIAINGAPSGPQQSSNFHLVHISRIQSFVVVSLAPGASKATSFEDVSPEIGPVDYEELDKREARAVAFEKEKEQRKKQGVTQEAEELFVSLGRMLPVRWSESKMIVNENVIINPPFRPEDCQASKENENSLMRVKKMVENERKKYSERASKNNSAQPLRKGG